MATFEEIQDAVELGWVYYVEKLETLRLKLVDGCITCKDESLLCLQSCITALTYDLETEVNTAKTTSTYTLLMKLLGAFNGAFTADPTVVIPGTTIIIDQSYVTPVRVYFNNQSSITISDWQDTYAPTFGNDPTLTVYLPTGVPNQYAPQEGLSPSLQYDATNLLLQSATFDWGYNQSGYILISI